MPNSAAAVAAQESRAAAITPPVATAAIDSHQQHLQTVDYLKKSARPCIVIAASGMCSGGRIVNYLKALLTDPCSDILFVGYQAQGTLGRDIQSYGPRDGYMVLDGEKIDMRAGVHTLNGYSAHADQQNLVNLVRRMRKRPARIRLVHGEPQAGNQARGGTGRRRGAPGTLTGAGPGGPAANVFSACGRPSR